MKCHLCTGYVAFALGATLLAHPAARAADVTDRPLAQDPTAPKLLPKASGDGFQLPPVAPVTNVNASARSPSLKVQQFNFRGNVVVTTQALEVVAAPYLGRDLTDADLEELRLKLTHLYVDRGYITSGAQLRQDAVSGSTVTFDLIEGKISSLRIEGLHGLRQSYVADRLIKNPQAPINMEELRQNYQLLLEDPLFERMNAKLLPDARLGEAILDVDIKRSRDYQVTVFANNYRPGSVGGKALGVSGLIRNLTGYGDVLDVTSSTADQNGGGRVAGNWKMPLNARGTSLSLQAEDGRSSVIEQATKPLDIQSRLSGKDVGVSQVAWESISQKLVLGINRGERKNTSTLLGQAFSFSPGEVDGVTKVSAWRFWQDFSIRSEQQALAMRSTFTSAKTNLQPMTGLPAGAAPVEPNYSLWLGQLQYVRQVSEGGAQVSGRMAVQDSRHSLSALDKMSLGGVYTVRGFQENTFVRDTGSVINLEFNYPVVQNMVKGLKVNLIPFYDRGSGRNLHQSADTLSSVGLATRMSWQGLSLDLAVAHRLQHPDSLVLTGGSLQQNGIHLQLSYSAF